MLYGVCSIYTYIKDKTKGNMIVIFFLKIVTEKVGYFYFLFAKKEKCEKMKRSLVEISRHGIITKKSAVGEYTRDRG